MGCVVLNGRFVCWLLFFLQSLCDGGDVPGGLVFFPGVFFIPPSSRRGGVCSGVRCWSLWLDLCSIHISGCFMFVFWCLAFPSVSRAPREASTVTSNKERRNSRNCRRTRVERLEGNPLPYERACWAPPVRSWPACEVAGSSLQSHQLHGIWVGKGDAVTEGNPCRGWEVACLKQVA